jgi:cell division protein FtsB
MESPFSQSIVAYQQHSKNWAEQLLAENHELRIRVEELKSQLRKLQSGFVTAPPLKEIANG